ncbi:hypothetical protein C488_20662 [Natrinema pellirubrum DSM 15624]|jgi:hypothetical protein|uniref:DUF8069 domain-containing protein n=1 Tax=Natrinema pellirubrum (strain DSM 15624 / CIP 106293 / JCM 10476 / NCIMB 786 / 157) TaxID=797303 RepID=L0JT19_NATP1|nr:hypothetical protein [Natrinema pellirubrum]AGB33953.1 hypothetical protein Natpe_4250 [Natrinema pellirubrum DSM 15624]ELY69138.1 hypothetical protein C488_20662 [Natrinema pellirubrum DSM 15624]
MTEPDAFDDTTADYERLETELLAQDRDAARPSTADVDETTARQLVSDLVDDDLVTAVAEQRVLVHEPSGEAFDAIRQLAVFHRGWTAAQDAGAEDE